MNVLYEADTALASDTALIKTNPDFEDLKSFLKYAGNYNSRFTVRKNDSSYLIPINRFIRFYSGRSPKVLSTPWMVPAPDWRAETTFFAGDCSNATMSAMTSFLLLRATNSSSLSAPT